jgi:hypothetical protein
MRDREEPVQARVGELSIPDPRADLDTEKPGVAHAPAHLVDGSVRLLQGDGPQRSEACWALEGDSGEELVLCCSQFRGAGTRCGVTERHRNRGKHLHRNAFTVHVNDPSVGRPAPMIDRAVGNPTEHQLRFGLTRALDAGPAIVRIDASQVGQISVDGMCVDIDEPSGDGQLSVDGWLRATV